MRPRAQPPSTPTRGVDDVTAQEVTRCLARGPRGRATPSEVFEGHAAGHDDTSRVVKRASTSGVYGRNRSNDIAADPLQDEDVALHRPVVGLRASAVCTPHGVASPARPLAFFYL